MKKQEKPIVTIVDFESEDVIITSGCEFGELDCGE